MSELGVPADALPLGPGRLVGVDAGGSASRVVVAEGGRVVRCREIGPMNALLTAAVPDQLAALAREEGADVLGVGMPGARTQAEASELAAAVSTRCGRTVRVAADAEVARLGAFLGGPGVVVAAGTGSVAIGWDGERRARAGGHGFLLGDDGGAYWIGREAVRATLRWHDGAGGSATLAGAAVEAAATTAGGLVRLVHERPADRGVLARLAPVVTGLAAADPVASRLVDEAAGHLAELAETVVRRLGPLPVAGVGGVFAAPTVWEPFAARTGARRPQAAPAVGALLLASGVGEGST